MPRDSRHANNHCTVPKRVLYGDPARNASSSLSESILSEPSTASSILSSDTPFFSFQSGSASNLPSNNLNETSRQYIDVFDNNDGSPAQEPLPVSTNNRHHSNSSPSEPSSTRRRQHQNNRRDHPQFLRRRCLIIIAIISLTSSLISCGFVAFCFVYDFVPEYEKHNFSNGDYDVCVPCHQLGDQTDTMREQFFITTTSDKVQMCCSRNSGQFSALLQNIMNKRKNLTRAQPPEKRKFRASPVSVHKNLRPGGVNGEEDDKTRCKQQFCHLKLSEDPKLNHEHARGVSVRNNTIDIKVSGWYYIYSSIRFVIRPNDSYNQSNSRPSFHFAVKRVNPIRSERNGPLMTSFHTYSGTSQRDHQTNYAGGMFELVEKDQIYVVVSDNRPVVFDVDTTFIGLVLMKDSNSWPLSTTPFSQQSTST